MSQKGFTNIILMVVIIAILIIGGYLVLSKKSKISQELTVGTNIESTTQQIDNTNWKTYKNTNPKFEIKYPPNWSFRESKSPTTGYINVTFNSPPQKNEDYFQSALVSIEVANQLDRVCAQPPDLYKEFTSAHIFNISYKLQGTNYPMQVLRFVSVDRNGRDISTCTRFYVNSRDFIIEGHFPKEFDLDKLAPYFDEFIKSFSDKTY